VKAAKALRNWAGGTAKAACATNSKVKATLVDLAARAAEMLEDIEDIENSCERVNYEGNGRKRRRRGHAMHPVCDGLRHAGAKCRKMGVTGALGCLLIELLIELA